MSRVVSSAPVIPVSFQLEEFGKSGFSYFSEFKFSWEKGILLCNIAALVAGIAYGFFMRLPLITASSAIYGLFYLSLYLKVKNARPSSGSFYQLQAQLEVEQNQNKELSKKLEANLSAKEMADELGSQVNEDQAQLNSTIEYNKKLNSEITHLRGQRDSLKRERQR